MADLRSKSVFGSASKVDEALASGKVNEYDMLFLGGNDETPQIGWIDGDGNKIIVDTAKEIVYVDELPETGIEKVVYVYNFKFYLWDGTKYVSLTIEGGVDETTVNSKIETATTESKNYTDEQISSILSAMEVVII